MREWRERAPEEAQLLNPCFLALLSWSAAADHHEAVGRALPFELAFLVPPVILHKGTREALPRSVRTSMPAWLHENPFYRAGLPERALALTPFVREALLFGVTQDLFIVEQACLVPAPRPRGLAKYLRESSDEIRDCLKRAGFVGKWFASAGPAPTVMALWGVKP